MAFKVGDRVTLKGSGPRCRSGEILAIMLGVYMIEWAGVLVPPMAQLMTADQLELVGEREEY